MNEKKILLQRCNGALSFQFVPSGGNARLVAAKLGSDLSLTR